MSSTCPLYLPLVWTPADIVAPSTHWKCVSLRDKRCMIMLSSIPRRLSSDVLLAAELGSCKRSRTGHRSFGDMFRTQQDHTSLRKAHHTTLAQSSPYNTRNISVCSRPVENAAHSAPREFVTTRRILREFQASTDTVEDAPRNMFGCAAMIT